MAAPENHLRRVQMPLGCPHANTRAGPSSDGSAIQHPVADLSDACSQPTGTRGSIVTPTCQIQLRVIDIEVNVDVVFGGGRTILLCTG